MNIEWDTVIVMENGKAIPDLQADGEKKPDLTLGLAAQHALFASYSDEQNLKGEEKFKRGALAVRISEEKPPALTAEEIVLIKNLVAKMYGAIVVYRCWLLLDSGLEKKSAN